jgi:hypothetical protein
LLKVQWLTRVLRVILVGAVWNWAVASNERARANARAAATECSRLRVERAEVEQLLADLGPATAEVPATAATIGR